jgi:ribosomal protein S18 acetylase RimI-like enzyme
MNIDFRPAEKSDLNFLLDLRKKTMNIHLKNSGVPTDKQTHLDRILHRFDLAKIVSINGIDLGLLKSYHDQDKGWVIVQLQISPDYQGKGIGSKIISDIIDRAASDGCDVTLEVLKENPAKILYQRLGFETISQDNHEYKMRIQPNK